MKRLTALFLLTLMMFILPAPVFAEDVLLISPAPTDEVIMIETPSVVDGADLLTDSEEGSLSSMLEEISLRHMVDLVVVTTDSTGELSPMEYADDFFDYGGYGFGVNYDGILLLISMEYGDWWISTTGFGIDSLTDGDIQDIGEKIVPCLSDGEFYTAFETFADECDIQIEYAKKGEQPPREFDMTSDVAIPVVISMLIAFIIVNILKGQLKTVHSKAASADYVVAGSMNVDTAFDRFVTSHITRTERAQDDDDDSTSTHTSSSGRTHGGGGGKF